MSRFFSRAPYAEDQPYAHTILWTHTLYRGFQTGATIGILTGATRAAFFSRPVASAIAVSFWPHFSTTVLRHAGIGSLVGTALMVIAVPLRMRGREEIEWQDRSWRLLENKHQVEVDDFSLLGMAGGAAAAALARPMGSLLSGTLGSLRWQRVVGGAGVGSMVGVGAYMGWRYGIQKGRYE
ncbi:MAG: hypothetical protein MMC33_006562 [Icmadophila ericetorum]|nr:hypothetical protein [Icmadophila ericetorum]